MTAIIFPKIGFIPQRHAQMIEFNTVFGGRWWSRTTVLFLDNAVILLGFLGADWGIYLRNRHAEVLDFVGMGIILFPRENRCKFSAMILGR